MKMLRYALTECNLREDERHAVVSLLMREGVGQERHRGSWRLPGLI